MERSRWLSPSRWLPEPGPRLSPHPMLGPSLLLLLFAVVLLRTAWVCDDAFITLRTVDNFVEGRGLRWNVAERVQAYTHPLWLFLLSVPFSLVRNPITVPIVVGFLTSMLTLWWLARRVALTSGHAMLGLGMLLVSRAFVDYSTSGLENPLSHLLIIAGIWWTVTHPPGKDRDLFWLAVISGLALFNRLDLAALFAPALAWYWWQTPRRWRGIGVVLLAFSPLILWELISLVYYGFPVPNTAYAKLDAGVALTQRVKQGFFYYANLVDTDPVTFAVILGGLGVTLMQRTWSLLPWALGSALYLLYIVYIGGDFMAGRFFTGPLLVSVALLMRQSVLTDPARLVAVGTVVVALGFASPSPTLLSDGDYGEGLSGLDHRGIADERAIYFKSASLMHMNREIELPSSQSAEWGRGYAEQNVGVTYSSRIGYLGFLAGPQTRILDVYALADPLLSRMPPKEEEGTWRIGHVHRLAPVGYKATLLGGTPKFTDAGVAEFYRALTLITEGPLWSSKRFSAIWKMNTGGYDHLLDTERIRAAGDDQDPPKKKRPPRPKGKKTD